MKVAKIFPVGLLVSLAACTSKPSQRVVNLASWSNYSSPEMLAKFEQRTGIRVQVSNYSSNEELLAKLQAGASGYDVAIPSDYMVFVMSKLGLLTELDRTKIPRAKGLEAKYLGKPYDPKNLYSLPYSWGTTGIAVNRTLYSGQIRGWKDVIGNPQLAGKYTLLDDVRETMGAALKATGSSLNSVDPKQLDRAKALLIQARKQIKGFTSEPTMPLVQGETAIAHAYLSDSLQARKRTGGKVDYVIPEEGCTLWIDSLVIPQGAQHIEEAHAFIDFMFEAETGAQTVQSVLVASTNGGVFKLLPSELSQNKALYPDAARTAKCEMMQDLGTGLELWDRIWTEVKAARD